MEREEGKIPRRQGLVYEMWLYIFSESVQEVEVTKLRVQTNLLAFKGIIYGFLSNIIIIISKTALYHTVDRLISSDVQKAANCFALTGYSKTFWVLSEDNSLWVSCVSHVLWAEEGTVFVLDQGLANYGPWVKSSL